MLGIKEQRQIIAEQTEAKYDAYVRYEELTDQSERLNKPMVNSSEYQHGNDNRLFLEIDGRCEYLDSALDKGCLEAARLAQQNPGDWEFEYVRRGIEREELDEVQAMQQGEKMMVLSIIPDAVREGATTINGYDRSRLKTLVRLFERDGDHTKSISFSLDQSNYEGLQFAAATVGVEVPDGLASEELLAQRYKFDASQELSLSDLHEFVREGYDLYLERQFGKTFYAGRGEADREADKQDAMTFIEAQPDLIRQHMEAVKSLTAKLMDKDERTRLLESVRYDFAAALDARMNGQAVDSVADAGDAARDAGLEFSGDCPTGSAAANASSNAGQLERLGYNRGKEMKWMTCPFCNQRTQSDVCAPVCTECGSTPGNDKSKAPRRHKETVFELIERKREEDAAAREEKQRLQTKQAGKTTLNLLG